MPQRPKRAGSLFPVWTRRLLGPPHPFRCGLGRCCSSAGLWAGCARAVDLAVAVAPHCPPGRSGGLESTDLHALRAVAVTHVACAPLLPQRTLGATTSRYRRPILGGPSHPPHRTRTAGNGSGSNRAVIIARVIVVVDVDTGPIVAPPIVIVVIVVAGTIRT